LFNSYYFLNRYLIVSSSARRGCVCRKWCYVEDGRFHTKNQFKHVYQNV